MTPKIARLGVHLDHLANHPHVSSVRQCGLIAGIELVRERPSDTPYPWQEQRGLAVCQHARAAGVWLRPLRDVVVVMPPLAIEIEQLDQIMQAVRLGIDAATDERQ